MLKLYNKIKKYKTKLSLFAALLGRDGGGFTCDVVLSVFRVAAAEACLLFFPVTISVHSFIAAKYRLERRADQPQLLLLGKR